VEETNGTNRPGSTLGNGTTEEALIEEIATGTPYKCNGNRSPAQAVRAS
jgi:hypothetical protein